MIQEYTCDCLNVRVKSSPENITQEELNVVNKLLLEAIPVQKRNDLKQFLSDAKWIKLTSFEPVKIRYNFLCLKNNFANFQINYCTICEKETHAILLSPVNPDGNKNLHSDHLALVCMNDGDKIDLIKSNPAYSAAFDIVLSRNLAYQPLSEINVDLDFNPGRRNFFSEIDLRASEKVQQFLSRERQEVDERIKNFALEENRKFDELRQTVLDEQSHFIRMVKTIGQQHDLIKENFNMDMSPLNKSIINESTNAEIMDENIHKSSAANWTQSQKKHTNKIRSVDFDGLFDIDDIDVDNAGKANQDDMNLFEEEESEQDYFPSKESTVFSKDMLTSTRYSASNSRDELQPLPRVGMNIISNSNETNSRRKVASSVVQNIPHPYQSKNRYHHQTPNSLPIKIPHFRGRMSDVDNDEGYDFKSGESIADRMMKITRNERNENEIDDLTDRPRRRLNTGDIIKYHKYH